jgi:predicted DCC family thiol-disulfide oxidoreductase YuxK
MTDSDAQGPRQAETVHLVLYDGVCGLSSSLLQVPLAHDRRGVSAFFAFASLQSRTGRAVVERFVE